MLRSFFCVGLAQVSKNLSYDYSQAFIQNVWVRTPCARGIYPCYYNWIRVAFAAKTTQVMSLRICEIRAQISLNSYENIFSIFYAFSRTHLLFAPIKISNIFFFSRLNRINQHNYRNYWCFAKKTRGFQSNQCI